MQFYSGKVFNSILSLTICASLLSLVMSSDLLYGKCSIDMRLPEVLRLKRTLDKFEEGYEMYNEQNDRMVKDDNNIEVIKQVNETGPTAMALVGQRDYQTSYSSYQTSQPAVKASKLQTLFQISITALAFLSFGGYLLCVIVQAIKSKGTTYFHPIGTTMATINGGVKRIKIYRRTRK